MTTERNLWAAQQDPGYARSASARRDTCDCGQDLYLAARVHCPRCGVLLGESRGAAA